MSQLRLFSKERKVKRLEWSDLGGDGLGSAALCFENASVDPCLRGSGSKASLEGLCNTIRAVARHRAGVCLKQIVMGSLLLPSISTCQENSTVIGPTCMSRACGSKN